ncbi:MAG: ABC transporter permease [Tannerellaceae bacterium]|nr:ABC transporter permease [Tannerellaceae bacterium]
MCRFFFRGGRYEKILLNTSNSDNFIPATVRSTDASFWYIYSFTFVEGAPFTKETVESGLQEAVISESMAQKLFRGENVLGQTFEIYEIPYRVIGIFKDVSAVFTAAYADVWVPNTSDKMWETGSTVIILLKDKKEYPALLQEIRLIKKNISRTGATGQLLLTSPLPTGNTWGTHMEEMQKKF